MDSWPIKSDLDKSHPQKWNIQKLDEGTGRQRVQKCEFDLKIDLIVTWMIVNMLFFLHNI